MTQHLQYLQMGIWMTKLGWRIYSHIVSLRRKRRSLVERSLGLPPPPPQYPITDGHSFHVEDCATTLY